MNPTEQPCEHDWLDMHEAGNWRFVCQKCGANKAHEERSAEPNVCTRCGAKREEWWGAGYRQFVWPCSHRQIGEHTQSCGASLHPSAPGYNHGCDCGAYEERKAGRYLIK